jgi:hypothetical protein
MLLKNSLEATANGLLSKRLAEIIKRLFFLGILLPALFGFFSVSFRGCPRDTYQEIIAERSYLVAKNQDQLSSSLYNIAIALLIWGIIILAGIVAVKLKDRQKIDNM